MKGLSEVKYAGTPAFIRRGRLASSLNAFTAAKCGAKPSHPNAPIERKEDRRLARHRALRVSSPGLRFLHNHMNQPDTDGCPQSNSHRSGSKKRRSPARVRGDPTINFEGDGLRGK